MNTPTPALTLVVIFGGRSAEHDVSCVTAAHVIRATDPKIYRIIVIGITRDGEWVSPTDVQSLLDANSRDIPSSLTASGTPMSPSRVSEIASSGPTVVVPLLHGPLGEDGTIQGMLEMLDVAYVGSGVLACAVAMDKVTSKQLLGANNVPQCRWTSRHVSDIDDSAFDHIINELSLPIFVKPANMGSSVGISKAKSRDDLVEAVRVASLYDEWIVFEEAVAGREIEVSVLGNLEPRASVAGEIIPGNEFYDYEDKYVTDGAQLLVPAPLTSEQMNTVQHMAIDAYRALRCEGMARVDFFFEEHGRGFLCNEINTIPGFTPISMYPKLWNASGLGYSDLIDELVSLARERYERRPRTTTR
jgi:D-alanine-D-alanine ligase